MLALSDISEHDYQAVDLPVFPQWRRTVYYIKECTIFADKNIFVICEYLSVVKNLKTGTIFGGERCSIGVFIVCYIVHSTPAQFIQRPAKQFFCCWIELCNE